MNIRSDEHGSLNVLLIPLILSVLLLFGALGFGAWAYTERTSYKDDVDAKIAAATAVAVEKAKTEKDNEFIQREKEPLKDYTSPVQFASFNVKYPKTWSAYTVDNSGTHSLMLQPNVVSGNPKTAYALRAEVVSQAYDQVLQPYETFIKQGKAKATAYALPKVPGTVGLRIDGQLSTEKSGAAVLLPVRDKTLKLSAESQETLPDFNNIILPNLVFNP